MTLFGADSVQTNGYTVLLMQFLIDLRNSQPQGGGWLNLKACLSNLPAAAMDGELGLVRGLIKLHIRQERGGGSRKSERRANEGKVEHGNRKPEDSMIEKERGKSLAWWRNGEAGTWVRRTSTDLGDGEEIEENVRERKPAATAWQIARTVEGHGCPKLSSA